MEWIVIWIVCGIICTVVAQNKGRDGCGWFALGLLLGPFGIVLALVMPADQEAQERKSLQQDSRKCPACAELIKREASKCKHCGEKIEPLGRRKNDPGDEALRE